MKLAFQRIAQAGVLASALALPNAYADSPVTITVVTPVSSHDTGAPFTGYWGNRYAYTVLWNVNTGSENILAFCIEPTVFMDKFDNSYAMSGYEPSDSVKRLYELFYPAIVSDRTNYNQNGAFQLALWELQNDDGNFATGSLYFASYMFGNTVLAAANNMLSLAQGHSPLANTYQYNRWISEEPSSQMLLSVSQVPEPASWAMLIAGLAVAGGAGRLRRQS